MGFLDRLAATIAGEDPLPPGVREEIELALALAERGDLADALARLEGLAASAPRAGGVFVALGTVRARRGDDEGAVAAFGRAVDLARGSVDGWLGLGEALVRLGRAEPARDALRRVLSAAADPPRRARAHAARGRLARRQGALPRAIRELRKAAELAPEDLLVCADLGRALLAVGDGEGWSWLIRAAKGPPWDPALVAEAALGAPDSAVGEGLLREARAACAAAPEPEGIAGAVTLTLALARLLARGGRGPEALAEVDAAVAAAPTRAEAHAVRAQVLARAGRHDEALAAAERAAAEGAIVAPDTWLRLALGAGTREALGRAAAHLPEDLAAKAAVRAVADGTAREEQLLALAPLVPGTEARARLARALAPGEPPAGDLYGLLSFAHALAAALPELGALLPAAARALEGYDRPLLVAVMGEFNAGKSSFVNALCGEPVAAVGVTPTTATINVLRHGPPGGRVLYHDGRSRDLDPDALAAFLGDLPDAEAASVRAVEIFFPLDFLRRVEIVDTPGLNSLRPEHEAVARGFLVEADAIVWLFAVGQAAKATERDALGLARDAGKRVLGVLSKADQASAEELAAIERHVHDSLGDRVEALLPLSAREALRARKAADEARLEASGLPRLLAALEERFFAEARRLKARTAMGALERFVRDARARAAQGEGEGEAPPGAPPGPTPQGRLDEAEAAVRGALAAERVTLRARLEAGFRQGAAELLELLRPRSWPLGERPLEASDEELAFDVLEDAVTAATEGTRAALAAAAAAGPPLPIDEAIERFRAYVRGVLAGGLVARFLREDLPAVNGRAELAAAQRALVRRVPEAESELFRPLEAAVGRVYATARRALEEEEARAEMQRLARRARLVAPVEALAEAVAALPRG